MARIARRRVLALSASGGMAAILASGRAPAIAQETGVHWLRWADFVPASDVLLKGPITQECKKALGITLKVETVNANDLQSRITSAIQSGAGADIIMAFGNWPQLYHQSLAECGDLADELGKAGGGYYDVSRQVAQVRDKWIGVPWTAGGAMIAYRKSWLDDVGATSFPATWEAFRDVGKKLKAKGRPFGQTAGHTFGDAPGWWYPFLWSFGGKEVEADGKTVVLNSKETVESIKYAVALWKETMDEGGLAWDDTNNNRAFHAGEISSTLNGASIYIVAKRQKEKIKDDKGEPMWQDIDHAPLPAGPAGSYLLFLNQSHAVMKYSKNQKLAKDFLTWLHKSENFGKWFTTQEGYSVGSTKKWENDPMWGKLDEPLKMFRTAARNTRLFGHAGPSTAKATEAFTKYVITDMYAKAVQGMKAEDAVKWAEGELKKIYEG
jgi:ABC-type glycerol-3-phosphate transport system substrate-binding protein